VAIPKGEIVARPMVARACGCLCEFQHYAVDKYRPQRLAKFQSTRCPECVAKRNEEHRQAAAALPSKGETFRLLPPGTHVTMTRQPDGKWTGTLAAEGTTVSGIGDSTAGLGLALARSWLAARAKSVAGASPA
jgi:hypothetical protein